MKSSVGNQFVTIRRYMMRMATAPALSVIMSVYNGAQHLYPAVQSILDQDFTDFEFLIVNDGSTDASGAILKDLAETDARIQVIDRENRGLVASLNEMLTIAKSPLLARMDSDDIAMPTRFSNQIAYLAVNPDVGILGTSNHDLDENDRIIGTTDEYPVSSIDAKAWLQKGPPLCHPSVMMRTELIRRLGGYRKAFRHAEDYDLWLRASRHTEIANLPDRLLLYRRSDGQISQKYAAEQATAAAIAWLDHERCLRGHPSLFDHAAELPSFGMLDELFGTTGVAAAARKRVVEKLRYSPALLSGPEFSLFVDQARSGNGFDGSLRTILRLGKIGKLRRAVALASVMAGALLSSS